MPSVTVSLSQLARSMHGAGQNVDAIVDELLNDYSAQAEQNMKRYAPRKTGNLINAITTRRKSKFRVEIGPFGVKYAKYVVEGTRPHTIYPRKAKALKFVVQGVTVFAKSVNHPGTQPNDFITKTAESVTPAFVSGVGNAAATIIVR